MRKSFPAKTVEEFAATKYLYIRSGNHRFIPIWVVVVDGRVIVRSWNNKENGWYRAFLAERNGDVRLTAREISVRAIQLRSQQLNDAADEAYATKYTTKANLKYVDGFRTARRKATTLELVPR
jgi:hypothetical protein